MVKQTMDFFVSIAMAFTVLTLVNLLNWVDQIVDLQTKHTYPFLKHHRLTLKYVSRVS